MTETETTWADMIVGARVTLVFGDGVPAVTGEAINEGGVLMLEIEDGGLGSPAPGRIVVNPDAVKYARYEEV